MLNNVILLSERHEKYESWLIHCYEMNILVTWCWWFSYRQFPPDVNLETILNRAPAVLRTHGRSRRGRRCSGGGGQETPGTGHCGGCDLGQRRGQLVRRAQRAAQGRQAHTLRRRGQGAGFIDYERIKIIFRIL